MTVFVDTSAVVALLSAADTHHLEAAAIWRELLARRTQLLTSDLVLAETIALARARAGFDVSVRAGERLVQPPFEMAWADRALFDEAWALYRRYDDHALSLCDCVSFALMSRRRIRSAFTFDSDFEAVGFLRLVPNHFRPRRR